MKKLDSKLKNRKIKYDFLEEYGFVLKSNTYIYERYILDDTFKVVVEIKNDEMKSKLIEVSLNDEYLMADVENVVGDFVGKVREEYNKVIDDIIDKCSVKDVFKSKQAIEVINYIKDKYNDDLEFLWEKFDNNAIWRNRINNKWYALLLVIPKSKLGLDSDELVEIIDLRYQKEKIKEIVDNKKIYPGYHMNKNSWLTIILDNSIDNKDLFNLIDNSYDIAITK